MKKWKQRIRSAIGMGLTWAAAWFGAGMALLLAGAEADVPFPLGFALFGFLAGVAFSVVLGVGERGRRFDELSLPRIAGWGAVGGLLLSGIFILVLALAGDTTVHFLDVAPVFGLSSAISAAGAFAIARRADKPTALNALDDVPQMPYSGDEELEQHTLRTPDPIRLKKK